MISNYLVLVLAFAADFSSVTLNFIGANIEFQFLV